MPNPTVASSVDRVGALGLEEKMPQAPQHHRRCDPAAAAAIAKLLARVQERLEYMCTELEQGTLDVCNAQDAFPAKDARVHQNIQDSIVVKHRSLGSASEGDAVALPGPASRWAASAYVTSAGKRDAVLNSESPPSLPAVVASADSKEVVRFELLPCWHTATKQTYADLVSDKLETQHTLIFASANTIGDKSSGQRYFLVMPHHRFYIIWNLLFMMVLFYETVVFPMAVFIDDIPALQVVAHFTLAFWNVDIVVSLLSAYYQEDGELVISRWRIFKQYAKSWLLPDVLVVLLDWVTLISYGNEDLNTVGLVRIGKVVRYFRVIRAIRFLRMRKVGQAMQVLDDVFSSHLFNVIKNIVLNMMMIIVMSHFVGCLWFLIGQHPPTPDSPSWIDEYQFDAEDWLYSYLTCLHWAVTQFTPGSMSVQPTNAHERFFAVCILVLGMIMFSSIVSSITAATTALRASNAKFGRQIWILKKYIHQQKISNDLASRISRFAATVIQPKQNMVSMDDVDILKLLPASLRHEVTMEVISPHLLIHPFFERFVQQSKGVMAQVCSQAITICEVSKESHIFAVGQQAMAMYFIAAGSFMYSQPHLDVSVEVEDNSWLCEAVLWTTWVHQGILSSKTEGSVLAVDAERFQRVVASHRADARFAQQYGERYVALMNTLAGLDNEDESDDRQLSDIIPTHYLPELIDAITITANCLRLRMSKSALA